LAQRGVDRQARKAARRLNPWLGHDLADHAGDYDHYRRITITHAEGKLLWAIAVCPSHSRIPLGYVRAAEAAGRLLPDQLVISFCTDREGNIASLTALFEPLAKDIVFTRFPAGDCRIPPFVGGAPARLFTEPRLLLSDRPAMEVLKQVLVS
jgi:hypothetical protein